MGPPSVGPGRRENGCFGVVSAVKISPPKCMKNLHFRKALAISRPIFSGLQRGRGSSSSSVAFCGVARQLADNVLREKSGSDLDHICIRDSAPTSRSILCGYQSRLRSLVGWHADLVESRAPVLASPRRGCRHSVTVSDSRNLPSRPAIIKFYAGPFFFCGARSVL